MVDIGICVGVSIGIGWSIHVPRNVHIARDICITWNSAAVGSSILLNASKIGAINCSPANFFISSFWVVVGVASVLDLGVADLRVGIEGNHMRH